MTEHSGLDAPGVQAFAVPGAVATLAYGIDLGTNFGFTVGAAPAWLRFEHPERSATDALLRPLLWAPGAYDFDPNEASDALRREAGYDDRANLARLGVRFVRYGTPQQPGFLIATVAYETSAHLPPLAPPLGPSAMAQTVSDETRMYDKLYSLGIRPLSHRPSWQLCVYYHS